MSQANVELLRTGLEAWNRGDVQAMLDLSHSDLEWEENIDAFPGMDPLYKGHDGFTKWLGDLYEAWESFTIEPLEFIDAGDQVIVLMRLKGRGRGSGVEVDMRIYNVCTLRDGKLARRRIYFDREEALEAAGLSE